MRLNENSPWLTSRNCKSGDKIEFLDSGQWKESSKFTYDDGNPVRQLVFKVKHNGEEKQLSIIKPSRNALMEAFGDETEVWVGQEAIIELALNTQGGRSIVLKPVVNETEPEPVDLGEAPADYQDEAI